MTRFPSAAAALCGSLLLASIASPAIAERPDVPDFHALYTDRDSGAMFIAADEYDDTRVVFAIVACFFETDDAALSVSAHLRFPDLIKYTSKSVSVKQSAFMYTTVQYSGPSITFERIDVLVESCKASVTISDKDGDASFQGVLDQATYSLSCGSDLPTALGLDQDQTAAFVAMAGPKMQCKVKAVGEIEPG